MVKNSTKATIEFRQIEAGCQDTSFIVASTFLETMIETLKGETVAAENIDLMVDYLRLHLSGNAPAN